MSAQEYDFPQITCPACDGHPIMTIGRWGSPLVSGGWFGQCPACSLMVCMNNAAQLEVALQVLNVHMPAIREVTQ